MKIKPVFIGIIAAIGVAGFLLYRQFNKLMDYKLRFRSIKIQKVSAEGLSIKLGLNFENKSDIQVVLAGQKYDVFINSVLISTITSRAQSVLAPRSETPLNFDVTVGKQGIKDLLRTMSFAELLNIKKQRLKVASTLDLKIGNKVKTISQVSEDVIENWKKD